MQDSSSGIGKNASQKTSRDPDKYTYVKYQKGGKKGLDQGVVFKIPPGLNGKDP